MITPIILSLTCLKRKVLIPLINIQYIEATKKGTSRVVIDETTAFEVDESVDQISLSLVGLDIIRKPANIE